MENTLQKGSDKSRPGGRQKYETKDDQRDNSNTQVGWQPNKRDQHRFDKATALILGQYLNERPTSTFLLNSINLLDICGGDGGMIKLLNQQVLRAVNQVQIIEPSLKAVQEYEATLQKYLKSKTQIRVFDKITAMSTFQSMQLKVPQLVLMNPPFGDKFESTYRMCINFVCTIPIPQNGTAIIVVPHKWKQWSFNTLTKRFGTQGYAKQFSLPTGHSPGKPTTVKAWLWVSGPLPNVNRPQTELLQVPPKTMSEAAVQFIEDSYIKPRTEEQHTNPYWSSMNTSDSSEGASSGARLSAPVITTSQLQLTVQTQNRSKATTLVCKKVQSTQTEYEYKTQEQQWSRKSSESHSSSSDHEQFAQDYQQNQVYMDQLQEFKEDWYRQYQELLDKSDVKWQEQEKSNVRLKDQITLQEGQWNVISQTLSELPEKITKQIEVNIPPMLRQISTDFMQPIVDQAKADIARDQSLNDQRHQELKTEMSTFKQEINSELRQIPDKLVYSPRVQQVQPGLTQDDKTYFQSYLDTVVQSSQANEQLIIDEVGKIKSEILGQPQPSFQLNQDDKSYIQGQVREAANSARSSMVQITAQYQSIKTDVLNVHNRVVNDQQEVIRKSNQPVTVNYQPPSIVVQAPDYTTLITSRFEEESQKTQTLIQKLLDRVLNSVNTKQSLSQTQIEQLEARLTSRQTSLTDNVTRFNQVIVDLRGKLEENVKVATNVRTWLSDSTTQIRTMVAVVEKGEKQANARFELTQEQCRSLQRLALDQDRQVSKAMVQAKEPNIVGFQVYTDIFDKLNDKLTTMLDRSEKAFNQLQTNQDLPSSLIEQATQSIQQLSQAQVQSAQTVNQLSANIGNMVRNQSVVVENQLLLITRQVMSIGQGNQLVQEELRNSQHYLQQMDYRINMNQGQVGEIQQVIRDSLNIQLQPTQELQRVVENLSQSQQQVVQSFNDTVREMQSQQQLQVQSQTVFQSSEQNKAKRLQRKKSLMVTKEERVNRLKLQKEILSNQLAQNLNIEQMQVKVNDIYENQGLFKGFYSQKAKEELTECIMAIKRNDPNDPDPEGLLSKLVLQCANIDNKVNSLGLVLSHLERTEQQKIVNCPQFSTIVRNSEPTIKTYVRPEKVKPYSDFFKVTNESLRKVVKTDLIRTMFTEEQVDQIVQFKDKVVDFLKSPFKSVKQVAKETLIPPKTLVALKIDHEAKCNLPKFYRTTTSMLDEIHLTRAFQATEENKEKALHDLIDTMSKTQSSLLLNNLASILSNKNEESKQDKVKLEILEEENGEKPTVCQITKLKESDTIKAIQVNPKVLHKLDQDVFKFQLKDLQKVLQRQQDVCVKRFEDNEGEWTKKCSDSDKEALKVIKDKHQTVQQERQLKQREDIMSNLKSEKVTRKRTVSRRRDKRTEDEEQSLMMNKRIS